MKPASKYLATFACKSEYVLNEMQRREAMQALNLHHAGKEQIPLNEEVKPEHRESHYRVCRTTIYTVIVGLLPDGRLEIIE